MQHSRSVRGAFSFFYPGKAKLLCAILIVSVITAYGQVLDQLPGASAAYSLRLLRSTYAAPSTTYPVVAGSSYIPTTVNGPAIRVRRTSDDALQDIGFTANGDLDTSSLLTFIGGINLFTYSEQLNNAAVWSGVGSTIAANATAAPNTSATAELFNEDTTNNEHFIDYNYTTPLSNYSYSFSVFVKPVYNTDRYFIVRGVFADGTSSSYMTFNLNTGVLVNTFGGRWTNGSITPLTNGWYQLRGTYTTPASIPPATDLVFRMQYMVDNPLANVYTGSTTVSTALWGVQLQPGTTFLGYTPTAALPQLVIPTGYVHTWFDQSGNSRHLIQINQDNQPMVVDTGVVVRGPNGKVTVNFWGDRTYTASSFLINSTASITATNSTINMVTRWLSLSGAGNADIPFGIGTTNDTRRGRFFYRTGGPNLGWSGWSCDVTATAVNTDPAGAVHTFNAIQNGTALTLARDGVEYNHTLPNVPLTPSTGIAMGQLHNPSQASNFFTEMELSEAIVFAAALSPAERRILQCDQGSYYTTPTTIAGLDFYIGAVVDQSACKMSAEQVVWNSATVANATVNTNNLTKINTIGWDGGAASLNTVSDNGYLEFRAIEINKARMIGLSTSFSGINYTNIRYAVYLKSNATIEIYESGVSRGVFGSYAANDLFRVAIDAGVIRYFKNGILFYSSTVAPVTPMMVQVSLSDVGGTASQVMVYNPCNGTFIANAANTGPNPIYQWKLNGVNVGTNSNTYSNASIATGNLVTCAITLNGCASNAVTSNTAGLINAAPNPSLRFFIRPESDTSGCRMSAEQIAWRFINLDNTTLTQTTPTSISKVAGSGWDACGASLNPVHNNGYFQFTASQTNRGLMGGLSSTIGGVSYTFMQYAIYLANNGSLQIYETGINRGIFGTYATGDVLRVAIEGGKVNYYRNGLLFYTSLVAPSLPQYAHVCIADIGGAVGNLVIANRYNGNFLATVLNGPAGVNYNWTVNGATVQSGTAAVYSNPSLNLNDQVACTLQLTGCYNNSYASNTITNIAPQASPSLAFYIAGIPDQNACKKAGEQVVWKFTALTNSDRLTLNGNTATKRLTNGWDAVAIAYNTVQANGYLEFKSIETNKNRIIGLSANPAPISSYLNIQYGIYLQSNATIGIFESGVSRGNFGTYVLNDVFRIAVENNSIRYYKNGQLFFTSTVAPTLPLTPHVALNEIGATAADVYVWNLNNGAFAAYPINTTAPLSFTWKTNGTSNGGAGNTYSNTTLANGSVLTCDLSFASCLTSIVPSNQILIEAVTPNPSQVFYIRGVPDTAGCWLAGEQVVWSFTSLTDQQRLSITPTNVTKTLSGGWDAAVFSYNQVVEGGHLEFRILETNKGRTIGLSNSFTGNAQSSIQYGIFLQSNATFSVIEAGVNRGTFTTYTATDTFRLAVDQGKVRYYKNAVLFYTSNVVPVLPLRVHASFFDVGATLLDPYVWNPNNGNFTATVVNGSTPATYQWDVNGIFTGSTGLQFTHTTFTTSDIISADLQLGGCLSNLFASNIIRCRRIVPNPALSFFIRGEVEQNSCRMAGEEVVWNNFTNFNDLARVVKNRNNLTKQLSTGWDGGAASLNRVYNNGFLEFTASETNKARMIGLSTSYTTSSYTGIQFAIYLQNNGIVGIYESGTSRGTFGTYATGDIFRVRIETGLVKYYKNGVVFYTSTVSPSLPMLVYASLNDIGATLTNVMVYNYNNGDFVSIVQQAGTNLTYTWMVNGVVVQSGRATAYTNTNLNLGDIITCRIDQGGCLANNSYLSNTIVIVAAPQLTPDFFIEGVYAFPSCQIGVEQIKWSNSDMTANMSPVNINSLVKTAGNGLWNGGAASLNKVKNHGYFEFTATENNKLRAAGLSALNNGADQNTISFCFYLQSDGFYRIYENGTDRGLIGSYAPGSIFRIGISNNILRYYKDGQLVFISAGSPVLPAMADVSINEVGGTITNAIIVNYVNRTFQSNIQNGGTYNWSVNRNLIQSSNQYQFTPAVLNFNDTVTCVLNSSLQGCAPQTINSNYIVYLPAQPDTADFYIGVNGNASGCQFAVEQVKWRAANVTGATMSLRSDNSLIKLQSAAAWTGGAYGWNKVYNNGYLEFTATETNKARAVGLSATNTDASLATIQFAILLQNNGSFRVYESNADRGGFGNYVTGDVFRIRIENGVVRYYRNNTLFYTSNVAPTVPLTPDASFYDIGATTGKVEVGNYSDGTLQAIAVNAGSGPGYSWRVNANVVQTGLSNTYNNSNLAINDTVRCIISGGAAGCTPADYPSNYAFLRSELPANADFAIISEPATATCALVTEPVRWKLSDLGRDARIVNGNGLIRSQNSGWNCGAFSWNRVYNNGYLEFRVIETNKARMIGLSSTNPNQDWTSIQFAVYLTSSATFDIRQSGSTIAVPGATYAANDVFRIAVENNIVKYYKNGNLIYVSATTPVLPLMTDVSISDAGGTVSNATITNFSSGNFTATAVNLGSPVNYAWSINGAISQSGTSNTFAALSLQNNDTVSCVATSSLPGCSTAPFTSNIIVNTITSLTNIDFAIRGIAVAAACSKVREEVKWRNSELTTNVSINGFNELVKTGTSTAWDGGAASWNTVSNNGYFEFIAAETNKNRMIGLSTTNTSSGQNTIRYGILLESNSSFRIYENGNYAGVLGTFATNDTFRISVESNVVRYYKGSTAVFNSTLVPVLPLLVDVSIADPGGTVRMPVVVNFNGGQFEAVTLNAGAAPNFNWLLNGVSVQNGSSANYNNTTLSTNDLLQCEMTANLAGCLSNAPLVSNTLKNEIVVPDNVDAYVRGVAVTNSCNVLYEEVKWKKTDLLNVSATTNNIIKTQSDGVWDGGASSWNTVSLNGGFQFTVTENNKARVIGLSATNTNSSNTSIGFGFHLLATGELRIMESGVDRNFSSGYLPNDILRLSVETVAGVNKVRYYKNSQLLFTSTSNATVLPLMADISIFNTGGSVTNAVIFNPHNGGFVAGATNAGTANYEWKVNGVTVQNGTTSTYTNAALSNNDSVTCIITPGLNGCIGISFPSNKTMLKMAVLTINTPAPVCQPATVDLTSPSITAGTPPDMSLTYWTDPAGTVALTNPRSVGSGTYYIRATRYTSCSDIKPVSVIVRNPPTGNVTASSPELNCTVNSVQLTANGAGNLLWENNSVAAVRSVNQPGTYIATFTDAFNCSTTVNHVVFRNVEPPVLSILGNTSPICQGASVDLLAVPSTYNNALRLDGNSQSADLGSWFNYQQFTVEFWLRPSAIQSTSGTIIDNFHSSFTGLSWTCAQNGSITNQYQFICYTPLGSATATFNLTANTWQHVTLVKSNTALLVYINGNQVASTAWTLGNIRYDGTQSLRLGRWAGGTRFWNGQLDEVRIFNAAVPAAQIPVDMNSNYPTVTANLVAYYKMDQPDNSPTVINATTAAYGTGPLSGNPNFVLSGVPVSNTFSYSWSPGGSTANTISIVPNGPITYVTTVTGTNGCPRQESTELTVSLSSIGSIVATPVACQGGNTSLVTFHAQGANPPYTFYYTVNGVSTTATTVAGADSITISTPTTTPGIYHYELQNLVYANASFCLQSQWDSATVTVVANPAVTITSPAPVCAPATIDLTAANVIAGSATGLSYSYWTAATGGTSLTSPDSISTSGTYFIRGTETSNGCASTLPVTITIHPQPVALSLVDDTLCSGSSVAYNLNASLPSTYSWTTANISGGVTGASAGSGNTLTANLNLAGNSGAGQVSYLITPTSTANGCQGIADTFNLTVQSLPAIISVQDSTGCSTSPVIIGATASAGNIAWYAAATGGTSLGTGSSFQTPVLSATTTYYAEAIANGCSSGQRVPVVAEIEHPGQWLGYSNDWDTPGNWGCKLVPTSSTDVLITTTPVGGNFPVVSSNGISVCRDLTLEPSASVTVTPAFDLGIYGDLSNDGISFLGNGTLRFNANVLQHIIAPLPQQFGTLHMNNTKANNALRLMTDVTATQKIEFTDGVIDLNGNTLTLGTSSANGILTGAGTGNHINSENGYFVRHTNSNSNYLFPLGDSIQYTPIELNFHAGAIIGSAIRSKVTYGKQPNLIATNYLNRYWSMDPINLSATIDYDATYYYSNPAEIIGAGTLYPVKYSTASGQPIWSSCPGSGILFIDGSFGVHNLASKSFVWNNLASFSDFTGANTSQPLPIELLYFTATPENYAVRCEWATMSETNNDFFTLERSRDALNFESIGTLSGAGTTTEQHQYTFFDENPLQGLSYYRLRQTDVDGTSTTSNIEAVQFDTKDELALISIQLNNGNELMLKFNRSTELQQLLIFDASGKCVYHQYPTSNGSMFNYSTSLTTTGIYAVQIITADGEFTAKLFVP